MQHKYFAASNSAQGFKNYYPEVFSRAELLYIIKGGPGTGKSSFMKKYAHRAEGEGLMVEYYYCSSDPSSLDGVLIFGKERTVGILDGTAPHVSEPRFPGAREEIVNLGACWDGELLRRQKNEIIALSERKSSEYKNAYTFLRSVGNLRAVSDGLIEEAVDRDKMSAFILKIAKQFDEGELKYIPTVTDAVSMNGRVRFDTFEENAEKLYIISEFYGVGKIFLDELFAVLKKCDVAARVSFDPICPEHVDGIFLEKEKTAFVLGKEPAEKNKCDLSNENIVFVNSKRFADLEKLRDLRSELRYTERLAESSLDGALHALSKAKIYHFLLEDIYGKAMDWKKFGEIEINI